MEDLSLYQPMSKAMEGLMGKERTCPNSCSHWSRGTFLPNCPTQTSSTSTDFQGMVHLVFKFYFMPGSFSFGGPWIWQYLPTKACISMLASLCSFFSVFSVLLFLSSCSAICSVLSFTCSFGSFVWFYSHKPPRRRESRKGEERSWCLRWTTTKH